MTVADSPESSTRNRLFHFSVASIAVPIGDTAMAKVMEAIFRCCAGLDVHSKTVAACVRHIDDQGKIHATIAYGWNSATFYRKWGLDAEVIPSLRQGFLDPWAQQSPNADLFLKAFWRTARNNPQFISRLKRRYALFKETIAEDPDQIVPYPEVELPENVIPFRAHKVG